MVQVKSQAEIQANYTSGANVAPARYRAGVATALWQAAALEGQDLYEAQMARPEILARRATGINKVSDGAWRTAATEKGAPIIGARMTAAAAKMAANFAPYRAALEALTLPPRTVDPMQNVINRVGAVVQAMVTTKAQQG